MDGNWVLFRGERNIVSNCLISVITANKVTTHGWKLGTF